MTTTPDTHYEFETVPFTDHERKAIATYRAAIEGIPDSFDGLHIRGFGSDEVTPDGTTITFCEAEVPSIIRSYFFMLADWHNALEVLYGELRNTSRGPRFSTAGRRFLDEQVTDWYHLLNVTRREACKTLIGTAGPQPDVDAGVLTFSDIFGIRLDGRIAAESRG